MQENFRLVDETLPTYRIGKGNLFEIFLQSYLAGPMDNEDEFCKSYEPLIKCMLDVVGSVSRLKIIYFLFTNYLQVTQILVKFLMCSSPFFTALQTGAGVIPSCTSSTEKKHFNLEGPIDTF